MPRSPGSTRRLAGARHGACETVDLETGAIVGVTVQDADDEDITTCVETLIEAAEHVQTMRPPPEAPPDASLAARRKNSRRDRAESASRRGFPSRASSRPARSLDANFEFLAALLKY